MDVQITVPVISGFYAGLSLFLIIFFAYRVVKYRQLYGVGIGSGDKIKLDLAIRCHGNAIENVPLALVLLVLAELQGMHFIALHVAGAAILVGRLMHAWGLSKTQNYSAGRFYGTLCTWLMVLMVAGYLIVKYIVQLY